MYTRLKTLSEDAVASLLTIKQNIKFTAATGSRRRVGKNTVNALSIYNYSKWFIWKHQQREVFRSCLPSKQTARARQVWYLEIPPGNGFLDVMTYWVGSGKQCGKVCAYALRDQTIRISGVDVHLTKGEGIHFCLSEVHSISPSKDGQLWACTMVQGTMESIL